MFRNFSPPPFHQGLTLTEVARAMVDRTGARYAINLDGGGSSTMVGSGRVVNRPKCLEPLPLKCERHVATVICVGDEEVPTMATAE